MTVQSPVPGAIGLLGKRTMDDYVRDVVFAVLDQFQPTIFHDAEDVAYMLVHDVEALEKANLQLVTGYVQEYLNRL